MIDDKQTIRKMGDLLHNATEPLIKASKDVFGEGKIEKAYLRECLNLSVGNIQDMYDLLDERKKKLTKETRGNDERKNR